MASDDVKRLNPGIVFGPMGPVASPQRERHERSPRQDPALEGRAPGLGYRISLISCRRRKVDGHDNIRTGYKPIVDAITKTLGFASDDDPRLDWQYHQIISLTAAEGTIVKIDTYRYDQNDH